MEPELPKERAYHQAGRAVVCVSLFGARVVKFLNLEGDVGSDIGFETYSRLPVPLACRPPSHKRGEDRKPIPVEGIVDAHGVLAYSGIAAQREHLRRTNEDACEAFDYKVAGTEGREQLSKMASTIGLERAPDHFYDEYWSEAQRLLQGDWHVVEQVADALMQHRSLNGRRVDSLILGDEVP
jgi:hypothetical protein